MQAVRHRRCGHEMAAVEDDVVIAGDGVLGVPGHGEGAASIKVDLALAVESRFVRAVGAVAHEIGRVVGQHDMQGLVNGGGKCRSRAAGDGHAFQRQIEALVAADMEITVRGAARQMVGDIRNIGCCRHRHARTVGDDADTRRGQRVHDGDAAAVVGDIDVTIREDGRGVKGDAVHLQVWEGHIVVSIMENGTAAGKLDAVNIGDFLFKGDVSALVCTQVVFLCLEEGYTEKTE